MQQFFTDFPSVMQAVFQAALPDARTVLHKILLLVPFAVFEIWADKKINALNTTQKRKIKLDVITTLAVLLFFSVSMDYFIKGIIIFAALDIIDLLHSFWRKKHPDSDIW